MAVETYLEFKYSKKFYGNETNPGAHFPLNTCVFTLKHSSAKQYVDTLTELFSNLPTGAWLSWIVSKNNIQYTFIDIPRQIIMYTVHMMRFIRNLICLGILIN